MAKFKIDVNGAWCKGCGLCVGICPKSVLEISARMKSEAARGGDCIGCRQCENICPDLAITVTELKEVEKNG
ncbi:4Fe-4S ferredoxin [Synergistales bacterium]|nr:4Fe-4S ferredoxin [Synergistales bacterium]